MKNRSKNQEGKLAVILVFEKIFGFAKNLLFSFFYGTTYVSDAFNIALTIPDTIFSLLGNGVSSSFIPISKEKENKNSLNVLCSGYILLLTLLLLIAVILCYPFIKNLVLLFAPGFNSETLELSSVIVRISIISVIFQGLSCILTSFLQTNSVFSECEFSCILLNVFQCLGIIFAAKTKNIYLGVGILLGNISQFLFLLFVSKKNNFKFVFRILDKDLTKKIIVLSLPIVLGASANRLNIVIDKAIASTLSVGGISSLSYADSILLFIKTIFATSMISVFFPRISEVALSDVKCASNILGDYIERIVFYTIPISIGGFALSNNIISIVFMRGAFTAEACELTSMCFSFYIIGLSFYSLRDLFVKYCYARKDTKTPTINMLIGVALNIGLNFILSRFLGVAGLALATSVSALIILLLLIISLRKNVVWSEMKLSLINVFKIIFSSLIMFISIVLISRLHIFDSLSMLFQLLIKLIIGFTIYLLSLLVFKTYTIRNLFKKLLMQ